MSNLIQARFELSSTYIHQSTVAILLSAALWIVCSRDLSNLIHKFDIGLNAALLYMVAFGRIQSKSIYFSNFYFEIRAFWASFQ